jgi:23S rRNA pseudouridine1911/1915/1917 synthase
MNQLTLTLDAPGERLDRALKEAHPDLSRSQWQRLIKEEQVTIDGQPVKGSLRLAGGEVVEVTLPDATPVDLTPEAIPLDIRYEDDDCLVINKAAGLVVHPGTGHETGTIVHAVLYYCPDLPGIGGEIRPGIVHRLDKETSGLLIIAKTEQALDYLQQQFQQRTVKKTYLALVEGQIQPPNALIDAPIGRNPSQRKKMTVIHSNSSLRAREARTRYEVVTYYDDFSLVACYPQTGRTHQIRVHLAFAGFPIVGDAVYGRRRKQLGLKRHFLHAAALAFRRPSDGEVVSLEAELPPELQEVVERLEDDAT